jgi:hypothetical protein
MSVYVFRVRAEPQDKIKWLLRLIFVRLPASFLIGDLPAKVNHVEADIFDCAPIFELLCMHHEIFKELVFDDILANTIFAVFTRIPPGL